MHVASLKFQGGGEKSLKILYNATQRPVGYIQRAYSSGMLRQPNRKEVFLLHKGVGFYVQNALKLTYGHL